MAVDNEFCSVCLLRSVVIDIHQHKTSTENVSSSPKVASALPMAQQISNFSPNFTLREQQDPSEFLIGLLNSLMESLSTDELESRTTHVSNPIHFLIGMKMLSSIQCCTCSAQSKKETYESIWSVSIASYSSLREALVGFCAEEQLAGENSFHCCRCRKRVKARRICRLSDVSSILFIHLKRFVYDRNRGRTSKLKHFVSYPALLDLSPFIDEKDGGEKRTRYELYAVLVHSGEATENGHIFSYVRSPDQLWYKADDDLMTRVSCETVLNDRNSYILCYSKESTVMNRRSASTQCESRTRPSKLYTSTPKRHPNRPAAAFDSCSPVRPVIFIMAIGTSDVQIGLIYWRRTYSSLRDRCCRWDVKLKFLINKHLSNRYVLKRSAFDCINRNTYPLSR